MSKNIQLAHSSVLPCDASTIRTTFEWAARFCSSGKPDCEYHIPDDAVDDCAPDPAPSKSPRTPEGKWPRETAPQLTTGKDAIADFKAHVPNYTMDMNCATAALFITRKVGLTLPTV